MLLVFKLALLTAPALAFAPRVDRHARYARPPSASGPSSELEERVMRGVLSWFVESDAVAQKHREHVENDRALHLMSDSPFARAPDELKLRFVRSSAGRAVERFMRFERAEAGEWKARMIAEAAAGTDAAAAAARLRAEVARAPVVVYSFVGCPWCVAAKRLLADELAALGAGAPRVVELEDLGRDGKALRAALSDATGRTSMPNVFVGGASIGGFTDGDPVGELALVGAPGLAALQESGALAGMLRAAIDGAAEAAPS